MHRVGTCSHAIPESESPCHLRRFFFPFLTPLSSIARSEMATAEGQDAQDGIGPKTAIGFSQTEVVRACYCAIRPPANLHLNSSLPLHQQRELVRRAILLQRIRGTRHGVSEMVRILTSAPVDIQERQKPKAFILGKTVLGGGARIEDRFLKSEPAPSFMLSPSRKPIAFFVIQLESMRSFRNRFGERGPDILRQITQIVSLQSTQRGCQLENGFISE